MGCINSRPSSALIEERFINVENNLLYHHHNASEVDLIHRKYSHNGEINENHWMNIYCQLNLAQNQIKKIVPERVKIFY